MEGVANYTGGTGVTLADFIRNCKLTYRRLLKDPREQQLDGFGEWDFLVRLGASLGGEARDTYNHFMDEWNFTNPPNPNQAEAIAKEARREQWRLYRRDRTAFMTLKSISRIEQEPAKLAVAEPSDLDRLFDELQARFRISSTKNLTSIQNFVVQDGENAERMFARFNTQARVLEAEEPRVITADTLKTMYVHHLKNILSRSDVLELEREITNGERDATRRGEPPLTRHEIH